MFLPYDSELGHWVATDICILRKSDNFCKDDCPVEVDDPEGEAVIAPVCCGGKSLACVCSDLLPDDVRVAPFRLGIEDQLIAVEAEMRTCSMPTRLG